MGVQLSPKSILILGGGGHARVLISTLKALQRDIIGILDSNYEMIGSRVSGIPIIGNDEKINEYNNEEVELVNGIGSVSSTEKRKKIYEKFKSAGYFFTSVIHPTAVVLDDVQLGEGVQIMAGAIIQTGCSIGDNSIINTGAIIDHDCTIEKHVHIAPGAVLSGSVCVRDMTHIGTAATVIQGIEIGEGVIVGAGAVVISDIPTGVQSLGNPAKIKIRRK